MPDTTGGAYEEQVRAGQARFRQAAAEHTARECTRQAELARAEAARREWDREIAGLCQDLLAGFRRPSPPTSTWCSAPQART
jgi:hypothetical protein